MVALAALLLVAAAPADGSRLRLSATEDRIVVDSDEGRFEFDGTAALIVLKSGHRISVRFAARDLTFSLDVLEDAGVVLDVEVGQARIQSSKGDQVDIALKGADVDVRVKRGIVLVSGPDKKVVEAAPLRPHTVAAAAAGAVSPGLLVPSASARGVPVIEPRGTQDLPRAPRDEDYGDTIGFGTRKIKIWGAMKVEEWYDDNILLASDDEESDTITTIVPSLNLRWDATEEDHVQLSYLGREWLFNEHDALNGMEHFADALIRLTGGQFWLELGDHYDHRRDPIDLSQLNPRFDVLQNDAVAGLGFDGDHFDAEVRGGFRTYRVKDDVFDLYDHHRSSAEGLIAIDLFSKTQLILDGGWSWTAYQEEDQLNEWVSVRGAIGFRSAPTAKLRGWVKAGVVSVDSEEGAAIPSDDHTGAFVGVNLAWETSAKGRLDLIVRHEPVESIFTGVAIMTRGDLAYHHAFGERVEAKLGGYYEALSEVESGDFDRSLYGASAGLTIRAGRHLLIEGWIEARGKDHSEIDTQEYSNLRGYVGGGVDF